MIKITAYSLFTLCCVIFLSCSTITDPVSDIQVKPVMVLVGGGTFQMGSTSGESNELPVHSVTVDSFYIGKYEVMQHEWINVMGANPSLFIDNVNQPVSNVSWYDILIFCNKMSISEGFTPCYSINNSLDPANWGTVPTSIDTTGCYRWNNVNCNFSANGYRMPTEAEWEFAARGGNSTQGYTFSGSNNLAEVGWYMSNSDYKTHIVGSKLPNELGLYDMSGNVSEWVWDWYADYLTNEPINPTGASAGSYRRLTRGGAYGIYSYICRVAYRWDIILYCNYEHIKPSGCSGDLGFRLVRSSVGFNKN